MLRLVRLEFRHKEQRVVEQESERMAERIRRWMAESGKPRCEVIGPAPCFYTRLEGWYRWQIILRGEDPTFLLHSHLSELRLAGRSGPAQPALDFGKGMIS